MSDAGPDLLDRGRIKELREALGLSQTEAAARAGLKAGKTQWSAIENGRTGGITLATLGKIAAALGCDPCDLILAPDGGPRRRHRSAGGEGRPR
jgi:transcriptional regulator with XRE-family HTH domain